MPISRDDLFQSAMALEPTERAEPRAVADAMERDMTATLATKSDIQLLRQELRQSRQQVSLELAQLKQAGTLELDQLRQELRLELNLIRKDMELLRSSITVRLGSMLVVGLGLLFAALKLT